MNRKTEAARQLTEWAAVNAKRNQLVCGALLAGITKTEIHTITGIARTTIDRILEPIMTVTLYETNSDLLVMARGDSAWSIGPATLDMAGGFTEDASAWIGGDWEPNEADGQTPTHTDDLTAVAEWSAEKGLHLLVDEERIGGAATIYIGELHTYTAAIGTASDVVAGDFCDVSIAENEIITYKLQEDGTETPVYGMSGKVVMDAIETTVRTDEDDKLGRIEADAERILEANGWKVTGPWELADNAAYATVVRV